MVSVESSYGRDRVLRWYLICPDVFRSSWGRNEEKGGEREEREGKKEKKKETNGGNRRSSSRALFFQRSILFHVFLFPELLNGVGVHTGRKREKEGKRKEIARKRKRVEEDKAL